LNTIGNQSIKSILERQNYQSINQINPLNARIINQSINQSILERHHHPEFARVIPHDARNHTTPQPNFSPQPAAYIDR
jgi:hypothetical protein